MNLLGHCEEEEPFTRMMVFEYAPSGTLFEHLHSEYLRLSLQFKYCGERSLLVKVDFIQDYDVQASSTIKVNEYETYCLFSVHNRGLCSPFFLGL